MTEIKKIKILFIFKSRSTMRQLIKLSREMKHKSSHQAQIFTLNLNIIISWTVLIARHILLNTLRPSPQQFWKVLTFLYFRKKPVRHRCRTHRYLARKCHMPRFDIKFVNSKDHTSILLGDYSQHPQDKQWRQQDIISLSSQQM